MKKAVIYARYSSDKQTEQSIEGQLTVCRKYAADNDFLIVEEYIDRATTGTNDNRPHFRAMLKDAELHEWQYVIVYKGDRFARNRIESAINKKTLRDNGVKLISATENIPDTPEGIILESLLEGMAEYYSAELSQKVKRGMAETKKKGEFSGGHILFGWDIVDRKPVVNETEADSVRLVFELLAAGKSTREICDALDERGVKTKHGNPFTPKDIFRMRSNEKYKGADIFPGIVTEEIFAAANARRTTNAKKVAQFLLSGKIFCGECGGKMTGEMGTSQTGAVHLYYKCYERKKRAKACSMPSIRKEKIEEEVLRVCCEVLSEEFLPKVAADAYAFHRETVATNIALINLEADLAEKEKALGNLLKAIEAGIFTATTRERMEVLEAESAQLRYRIAEEKHAAQADLTEADLLSYLQRFAAMEVKNEAVARELIDLLIRRVTLYRDRLEITFNYSGKRSAPLESSNAETLGPPRWNSLNFYTFFTPHFWGVVSLFNWTKQKKR